MHPGPTARVALILSNEVEPPSILGSRLVGVEDGVIAKAKWPEGAVGPSAAPEELKDSGSGDSPLCDRGSAEPGRLVLFEAEFGVEDVLPYIGRKGLLVAAWYPIAGI